jgi:predicted nucleic-acid-binding Zn-ribbon protein
MDNYVFTCPKCAVNEVHEVQYIPPGTLRVVYGQVMQGECLAVSCRICVYTEKRPTADGEGAK